MLIDTAHVHFAVLPAPGGDVAAPNLVPTSGAIDRKEIRTTKWVNNDFIEK